MRRTPLVVCLAALCIVAGRAQSPTPEDLVKQGRALVSQGKLDEAISVYRKAVKIAPQSFDARLAIGIVLDLQGQYAEARTHLTDAIRFAPAGARNQAMTAMAISYAFESRAPEVLKYFEPVYKQQLADQDMGGAAATANAIGRVFLETGDTMNAAVRCRGCRHRIATSGKCGGYTPRRGWRRAKASLTRSRNRSRPSSR